MATSHLQFPPAGTSPHTNVASSLTVVTLLAANANRLGASIYNDSNGRVRVKMGAGASLTSFTKRLSPHEFFPVPFAYTGIITGIWEQVPGFARVVEFTA